MKDKEGPLIRLAEAVVEGEPVDWDRESGERPELAGRIRLLEALEKLSATHKPAPVAPADLKTHDPGLIPTGGRAWGHLEILEKLGEGSFGEVYRAHDGALQIDVALKLQRSEGSG